MVIAEAINRARARRDTELPDKILVKWLSDLDGQLWEDVVRKYEGPPSTRPSYADDADLNGTELMIREPYDDLYVDYLTMRIDLDHADYERYNNDAMVFEMSRQSWADWFNRECRWKGGAQVFEVRPKFYDTQILF